MKFAIIGAGDGSRLRYEGITTPKPLIKINGVPLIERILRSAAANGATEAHLIINESFGTVKEYVESHDFGMPINCRLLSTPSSMHTLFALAPDLCNEPFCLATVDSVFRDDEFYAFVNRAKTEREASGTLAVTNYIKDESPLCVALDNTDRILDFSDSQGNLVWATGGLYFFSSIIFDEIPAALHTGISRLRNFLRLLLKQGHILKAYPFTKIIDVDHVSDITEAEEFLNQQT
jgi:NDP-sugar pyrophosphorylase family protein